MTFAVTLLFDAATTTTISARWQLLAAAGVSNSMLDLGYPPHVSLVVYDELDVEAVVVSLDRVLGLVAQVPVTLGHPLSRVTTAEVVVGSRAVARCSPCHPDTPSGSCCGQGSPDEDQADLTSFFS